MITAGDINTPLTPMDRSSRHRINKETKALSDALDQKDLADIFKTLHPKATEYTFFSSTHGTFSKIDHILHTFRSQCMKLEINHRKKSGKPPKAWRLKNTLLKNEWVNQAIREEILKNIWKQMKMKIQQCKLFGIQHRQS